MNESGDNGGSKAFGSTFTWADGVAVTVGKPTSFKPSDTAAVTNTSVKSFVKVDITLKNGSDKPVEAMMLTTRATSGDQDAEKVFDSEKGIDTPTSKVLPGKSLKWSEAYEKPGNDFVLTVDWDFGNGSGTYQ